MSNGFISFRLLRKVLLPLLLFVLSLVSLLGLLGSGAKVNAAGDTSTLDFQARLLTAAGAVVPGGTYNIDFKIYSASTGGVQSVGTCSATCLWEETYAYSGYSGNTNHTANSSSSFSGVQLTVQDGYVSVNLGQSSTFASWTAINWDQPLYLSMNIGGTNTSGSITWDGEMGATGVNTARIPLTALPYAFIASQLAYTDSSSNRGVLEFNGVTNAPVIYLPNASGTVCLDSATACGFAPATGGSGYIQLQSTTPGTSQTGNFYITGTGIAGTFYASNFDTPSAGTLNIGNTNATTIDLGSTSGSTAQAINIGTTTSANETIALGSTRSGTTTGLTTGATSLNLATGGVTLKAPSSTGSTTAFVIVNAGGSTDLLQADSTNNSIAINGANTTSGNALYVNGTIGTVSGNIYVGGTPVCTASGSASCATDYIDNGTTKQSGNTSFYIQPASTVVAGVLEANGADTLDLKNASAVNVDSFGATGAVLINPSATTYTAFQVQDVTNSNNNILTIDTHATSGVYDDRVIIGNYDSNSGSSLVSQLYVGGSIPASEVNHVATGTNPESVVVQGNYAYVTNYNSETLTIYDISNPASPVALGSQNTNTSSLTEHPTSLYVQGSYAYVVALNTSSSGQIEIFNITNPDYSCSTAPCYASAFSPGLPAQSIYVQGKYMYIIASGGSTPQFYDYDISNPNAAVFVDSAVIGSASATIALNSIYVQGTYAYLLVNDYIYIYNIANPANLTSPTSINMGAVSGSPPTSPYSIYVQGRYAYVAFEGTNNLGIYDISTHTSCSSTCNAVGSVSTGSSSAPYDVYVQGRYAYVANEGNSTLGVYDISTPSSPVSIGTVSTASNPYGAYVEGRYAYVVDEGSSELQIFDMGGSYIQQLQTGGILTGTLQTEGNATINGDLAVTGGLNVAQGVYLEGGLGVGGSLTENSSALFEDLASGGSTTALQVDTNAGAAIITVDNEYDDVLIGLTATQGGANYCNGNGEDTTSSSGVCISQDGIDLEGTARAEETINLSPIYSGSYAAPATSGSPSGCTGGTGTFSNGFDTSVGTNYYKWTGTGTTTQCENIFLTIPVPQDFSTWDNASGGPFIIMAKSTTTSANTVRIQVFETGGTQLGSVQAIGPTTANTWESQTTGTGTIGWTAGVSASQSDFVPGQFFTVEVTIENSSANSSIEIGDLTINYFRWY